MYQHPVPLGDHKRQADKRAVGFIALTFLLLSTPVLLDHFKILPELIVMAIVGAHLFVPTRTALARTRMPVLLWMLPVWFATTLLWSEGHALTLEQTSATVLVFFLAMLVGSHADPRDVLLGLIVGGLIALALSLAVAIVDPSVGLMPPGYEGGTLEGIYDHRNTLAAVLTPAAIATLAVELRGRHRSVLRAALFLPLALGIALTQSSTALSVVAIAVVLSLVLAIIRGASRRTRTTVLVVLFASLGSAALAVIANPALAFTLLNRNDTLTGRKIIWQAVENLIAVRPWTGHGWGATWNAGVPARNYVERFAKFVVPSAHNGYLDTVLQAGIVGLVLLCLILLVVLSRGLIAVVRTGAIQSSWGPLLVIALVVYDYSEAVMVTNLILFTVATALVQSSGTGALGSTSDSFTRTSRTRTTHATAAAIP